MLCYDVRDSIGVGRGSVARQAFPALYCSCSIAPSVVPTRAPYRISLKPEKMSSYLLKPTLWSEGLGVLGRDLEKSDGCQLQL